MGKRANMFQSRNYPFLGNSLFCILKEDFSNKHPRHRVPQVNFIIVPQNYYTKGITFLPAIQARNPDLGLYATPTPASQSPPGHPHCPASCQALSTLASCPATSVGWPASLPECPTQSLFCHFA